MGPLETPGEVLQQALQLPTAQSAGAFSVMSSGFFVLSSHLPREWSEH